MSNKAAARAVYNTTVIAPDGDVILVAGVDAEMEGVRVSSKTLSVASPVFVAMFGPNFREGQQLRDSTTPVEIPLPDDNFRGVRLICQLLYLQTRKLNIDSRMDIVGIRHAVQLMDKYQMSDLLFWQLQGILHYWLFEHRHEDEIDMVIEAVSAAYLLDCDSAFLKATAHLVNECENEMGDLADDPVIEILPVRILLILESRRVHKQKGGSFESPEAAGLCLQCTKEGKQDRYQTCTQEH